MQCETYQVIAPVLTAYSRMRFTMLFDSLVIMS